MNVRWLWLNHVPAGLTLTEAEKRAVINHARKLRLAEPGFRGGGRRMAGTLAIGIPLIVLAFVLWLVFLINVKLHGVAFAISNVSGILVFNALVWVVIAYAMYRVNVPYVWRALCELKRSVCIECGYILEHLDNPSRCPECGGSSTGRMPAPPAQAFQDPSESVP